MLVESAVAADTTSLRAVIYGGGPIHLATATAMLERFGQVFVQIYGMGEVPMTISYLPRESHALADPEGLVTAGYGSSASTFRCSTRATSRWWTATPGSCAFAATW